MSPTARSAAITQRTEHGGRFRWLFRDIDARAAASFGSLLGIGPVAARVLYGRGYRDPDAARLFLHPSLDNPHHPLTIPCIPHAIESLPTTIPPREKNL